jgi:hypothetical protein
MSFYRRGLEGLEEVKSAVAARADLHCRHLDPGGPMVGGYWRQFKWLKWGKMMANQQFK